MATYRIVTGAHETLLECQRPSPRLAHVYVRGYLSVETARKITEFIKETIDMNKPHPITVFDDWFEVDGYDTEARRILTEFGKETKTAVTNSHICFKSKLVAMGVNVAGALVGNLIGYSDKKLFKDKFDSVVSFYRTSLRV